MKLGKAFLGALLLGGITSLPELTTTIVVSYLGNAPLAVSNLLGGISMQTVVLAMADLFLLKKALTYVSPQPILIMGGVLLIFQLAFVIICIALGEFISFYNIGLWSLLNCALYILFVFVLKKYEGQRRWIPTDFPASLNERKKYKKVDFSKYSIPKLWLRIILHAMPVVVGGVIISFSANSLVHATGMSSTFVGASIVAVTTSLPEITTTFYAITLGAYTLAISNIFGSNALMIGLLLVSDIFYRKGLIFNSLSNSALFVSALGILVTATYLWGLLERRNKTLFRMGFDSIVVIMIEVIGLTAIYFLE